MKKLLLTLLVLATPAHAEAGSAYDRVIASNTLRCGFIPIRCLFPFASREYYTS